MLCARQGSEMSAIRRVRFCAGLALCLAGCAPAQPPAVTLDGVEVSVIVADDAGERSQGLQGYGPLAEGEGMLFIFDDSAPRTFAMKGVTFPIDVVFIDEDLAVSAIEPLDPGDTGLVTSPGPCPYVIELPQGWAAAEGITVGGPFELAE